MGDDLDLTFVQWPTFYDLWVGDAEGAVPESGLDVFLRQRDCLLNKEKQKDYDIT